MIRKGKLEKLLEPHLYALLNRDTYSLKFFYARDILTSRRLDLAFKLFYLDYYEKNNMLANDMYREHIRAFSLGEFSEPGNTDKNSIEKYIESFHETFLNIKEHGFDSQKTLIPIGSDQTIINGAHRVASAIYLNKTVSCVVLDCDSPCYDYKFFYERKVPLAMIEQAVTTFVEYSSHVHIAFIWPIAKSSDTQVEALIPNIIYQKEMTLTPNGAHNLLSQIYYGEAWLGTVENDFSGSKGKLVECFKSFDPVNVIVFHANDLDEVLGVKEKIREYFNVGKHSIHITDTQEEALRTARIVLNENSIHFLNYAKPNRYLSTYNKIELFKNFLNESLVNTENVVIDSGMVLSAYGLREANDIDYFYEGDKEIKSKNEIEENDKVLPYYKINKKNLIYNSKYYFYFNNIKFVAFPYLYKMKTSRAEIRDINDCKMMEALIEDNQIKAWIHAYKQKLFYIQVLIRQKIIAVLQKLGLFDIARTLYKKIKGSRV